MNIARFVRSLRKDTRGANLVEYILLVGLMAILCIVAFTAFGGALSDKVTQYTGAVTGLGGP